MLSYFLSDPIVILAIRFFIDIVAMLCLNMGIYYRRYGDRELVTVSALFNVFVFSVLSILASVQFSIAAGFGLFAILALFTMRSEQITKIEITYLFGSVSLAVICAIQGTTLPFVFQTAGLVLVSVYLIDHPSLLPSVGNLLVTLDKIDDYALSNPKKMCENLSLRLGVEVLSFQVRSLDFINDKLVINVNYRKL